VYSLQAYDIGPEFGLRPAGFSSTFAQNPILGVLNIANGHKTLGRASSRSSVSARSGFILSPLVDFEKIGFQDHVMSKASSARGGSDLLSRIKSQKVMIHSPIDEFVFGA
jgi:hypothetical protein